MDAKDLKTESAVSERNNDGSKYSQGGGLALHCDRNKSYQDIGSNSLGKVDVQNARPCAVIGPDRVVPPPAASEAYHIKKGPAEPWSCMDNAYRRPPEYPHKLTNYQNPTRNISPRQTFQENMQRIMVPPTYNAIKVNDDTNYAQVSDRSNGLSKNIKLINMPPEAKFCEVPYAVNPTNNEHKNVRIPEMCLPSANPTHTRTAPHGWPTGSVNLHSTKIYGTPELYQYQDYPSCAGPRPVVPRPHRNVPEEQGYVYADPYYQEGNIRFKPYPSVKERYPQQRYEYIGNYSNPFHPPPGFQSHKYEIQKSIPPHPYTPYPPVKYLDSRVAEPVMEGYQRNPQGLGPTYNIQYRNQVIHPTYGPVVGNGPQNKMHSYPPDAHMKAIPPSKLPYDNNAKTYIDYENSRQKIYPPTESYFVNEMARIPIKSQVIMPNYATLNMHNLTPNPYYKKDTQQMKNYDHMAHFRNMDPNLNIHNPMSRHAPVFSPNTLAISPTDSNTSNDTTQTLGTSQEDCGYVSQSSTASVRSIDSGINRIPNEYLRKYYDNYNRYGPIVRTSPMMSKSQLNSNNNTSKDKKQIDVRQFLQMWNEGDEEQEENSSKEIIIQTGSSDKNNFGKSHSHEAKNSQEQLYVLGLVNVPSDELEKYEHIQKVSKLPENIKGYNSIELLDQFEEVIESSHMNNYKTPTLKESMYHMPKIGLHPKQATAVIAPRPVSPLDVESKISQSVIHKEVGCNFEIKPCSPKMLNVEVAAPVQNILAERAIEKVANPVMLKSPMLNGMNENIDCNMMKRTDHHIMNMNENLRIPSCKMINTQYSNSNSIDQMKSSYSIQDLESNSGLCLASLPRLDNDIELNFPEVNQQFINANKGDSTVLATSIRDLPTLEVLDQSPNQIKDKFNNINPSRPDREYDFDKSPYMVDSEKEFSKLSKYRKTKTFETKETLIHHNVNAFRTDSVIIKNPENIKNHEENSDFSNSLNKVIMDIQQAPINLTSQGSLSCNVESHPDNTDLQDAEKEDQLPKEIAIDSLNKTAVNSTEFKETKIESQMNTSTDIEENPLNTLNKDDSSDSVSLLPVFTEENENFTNMDDIDGNYSLDSIKDSQDVKLITEIKDKNDDIDSKLIPTTNESYQKIETEINKCALNSVDEIIVDVRNALLTSKTEISVNELVSNINSENCGKKICNSEKSTTDELTKDVNYTTLMEIDSEISQNPINPSLEENYEMDTGENATNVTVDEDFDPNHNFVDKLNSPVRGETKTEIDTSEINNTIEVRDPVETEKTQQHEKNILLTSGEACCNDCECSDLIQSQNMNSESQPVSKDYVLDHINVSIDRQDSTTQSSEELSYNEKELKDFEDTYSEDTQSIPEIKDLFDHDQLVDEDSEYRCEETFQRNIWYGSKELYSPWIQKLLTFSEGNCNSAPTKNDMDRNNDSLVDSIETSNTTERAYATEASNTTETTITTETTNTTEMTHTTNTANTTTTANTTATANTTEKANATEVVNTTEPANTTEMTHTTETANTTLMTNTREAVNTTETANTTEVTHTTETANTTGAANTTEAVNTTEPANTTEMTHTTETANTTQMTYTREAVNRTETGNTTEVTYTIETANTTETADTTEMGDTTEMANTTETADTTEMANTTGAANTTEAVNTTETANTTKTAKTTETANTTAAANTTTENKDDNDKSDCDLEIRKSIPLEEVPHKVVTEDVGVEQDNCNGTVEVTVDTSVLSSPILETVNSDDHFDCEDSTKDEVINNKENIPGVDEANNIVSAGTPLVTSEFKETNVIDLSLESETYSNENTVIIAETELNKDIITQCEVRDTSSNIEEVLCESFQEEAEQCDEQPEDKQAELESSNHFEHVRLSFNEIQANDVPYRKCQKLKRSLSDSALNVYNSDERPKQANEENLQFIWPFKRRKMNTVDNDLLAQKLCNIIHHNRRNSVSSFYNEDNVSFCILIDNSCIITEEESEEPEKVCYTELSEECLAEIQSSCIKHDEHIETLAEVALSPQQENACEYSDSFVLNCEEDKTLEESWDEDLGCVETVISDDIAEDIEICGTSSPKVDALSDNDESDVFSSSEHTDKVKFIYGDKMCIDDALFVETLYKTPQMDVNKTLYNRETRVSEYDRYYDNDSLEKMLSESNERPVSPYVPQYMETMFPFGKGNSKETPENKENMDIETFSPLQSKGNALDIVVDINVDKMEHKNRHSIEIVAKTRDDTVHSCESSVDNVFTYNQKDEDAIYTSSSPEVSSTTSEEKNSGILLKITNYKGSRISQINDSSRANKRSSCKFTEEKEYLHTRPNFSSNRPLLTKAAQKYIPPLKESIRDLKVQLSLPQHSLMKLKQLKISKDEPKVNKQNANISRIPKKPKPKFEDVLKSIDEIQFKKHKEKTKKIKKAIPKVVIKKNVNGSHYASTSNKDDFNPDMTGRKWQPWVFIEKNHFIDKMATRKKTKAIYSHRKRTYVLAEKFQKYKSINNNSAKFVITPPISDKPSSGLKYTIRLKHNY